MTIYKVGNLWNFYSFPDCKNLKIRCFSKLNNFRNLMIIEILKFLKF